jgi:uroporphyrinogen-III synthase
VRLLITRPEPDGARTAAALAACGHEAVLASLLRIEPVAAALGPGPWDGVIMTSANAARALATHPRRVELAALPAFVVGRRTGEAARAVGFAQITAADGDADDLVRLMRQQPMGAHLLYLAGADQAADLAAALQGSPTQVDTVVIYRAVTETRLPDDVTRALANGTIDGVLHFSARSAGAFVAALDAAGLGKALALPQFCLSTGVAKPLAAAGASDLRVAARPDEAALLDLIPEAT